MQELVKLLQHFFKKVSSLNIFIQTFFTVPTFFFLDGTCFTHSNARDSD